MLEKLLIMGYPPAAFFSFLMFYQDLYIIFILLR